MHERHDMTQIIPKTNSIIINGVASCVCTLDISPPHIYDGLPRRQTEGGKDKKFKQYPVRRRWIGHTSSPHVPLVLQRWHQCSDVVVSLCAKTIIHTEQKSIRAPDDSSPLWQSLQVVGVWITLLCWLKGAASGTQKPFLFPKGQSIRNWLFSPGHRLYFWNYAIIGSEWFSWDCESPAAHTVANLKSVEKKVTALSER